MPEIETAKAATEKLAVTVKASGETKAGVRYDVYPPTQGVLDRVYVSDGETVTAGMALAVMDTRPIELQVAQAKAALSQANAQLAAINDSAVSPADRAAAQANVTAARNAYEAAKKQSAMAADTSTYAVQLEAAHAATEAARNALKDASAAYDAYPSEDSTKAALAAARAEASIAYLSARAAEEQLRQADPATASVSAKAAESQAYAALKGAEAQLAKLKGNTSISAQRAAAKDGAAQARAALELAQKTLDDAKLVAPIDGVVIFNAGSSMIPGVVMPPLSEGSAVSPGTAPFTIMDFDALSFTAEVDEGDIGRIQVGMDGSVTLDAFSGTTINTKVAHINPVAQRTATGGTVFEVELLLTGSSADILLGMKGRTTIEVSTRAQALTVPIEAWFSEGGKDFVYVVSDNKLKKTAVTIGAETDTRIEVLSGLEEGKVVALLGATQYRDGMAVRTAAAK